MTPKELQEKIERHRQEIARLSKEGHRYASAAVVLADAGAGKPSQLFVGSQSAEMSARLVAVEQSEIFVAASQLSEISTRRIIRLTWFLAMLTLALVGLTIGLLILTYVLTKHP
jgi:hypothetical protein